ncbi:MAG: hypothetical protein WHX60_08550 [Armatimonadota bacterium]
MAVDYRYYDCIGLFERSQDVYLYNSPGTGQYKYAWHGICPSRTGTLRSFRVYLISPSGSPDLTWKVFPSVPADGQLSGTPAASGVLSGISAVGWVELSSNIGMSVTRGVPFAIEFGCTNGTSIGLKSGGTTATTWLEPGYIAGSWWASTDESTWTSAPNNWYYDTMQFTFEIESNGTTYYYGRPHVASVATDMDLTDTSRIHGQSFQLPYPVLIDGARIQYYPNCTTNRVRVELRRINTTDWKPDMSSSGLVAATEFEMSYRTKAGIDGDMAVPFDGRYELQNFCILVRLTRYDGYSISARRTSTTTSYLAYGSNTWQLFTPFVRPVWSTDGGSTWTVYTDRIIRIQPFSIGANPDGGFPFPPHSVFL